MSRQSIDTAQGTVSDDPLADLVRRARFECVPLPGIEIEIERLVPREIPITVTSSATFGIERTVDASATLSENGFEVVPHLAARLIDSRERLLELIERLAAGGIRELFVIGGDATPPRGPFASAGELMGALPGTAAEEWRLGVAGYPEGHPKIADAILREELGRKLVRASYVVTQICFEPETLRDWIGGLRALSAEVPVMIGVPGAVAWSRLWRMSTKVGVGQSLRYLRHNRSLIRRLVSRTTYRPDQLLEPLRSDIAALGIAGLHVFTFNQLASTLAWRDSLLGERPNPRGSGAAGADRDAPP